MIRRPLMMAEFASGPAVVAAAHALRSIGVAKLDAFTPYEVAGLPEALGERRSRLSWIVLAFGLAGGGAAYYLQWWINVADYPLNIGGRPHHSAPAFIPITFEMSVLFAALAALISAIVLGQMPRLWRPEFDVEGFERATIDRFWLAVPRDTQTIDRDRVTTALIEAGALRVLWLDEPLRRTGGAS